MKQILDAVVAIVVMAIFLSLMVAIIKPYAIFIVLALFIVLVGGYLYRRNRYW